MQSHEKMMEHYRSASSDTTMRDQCNLDMQRFFIDGEWWSGSSRYAEPFKNRPRPEFNRIWKNINRLIGDINDMESETGGRRIIRAANDSEVAVYVRDDGSLVIVADANGPVAITEVA